MKISNQITGLYGGVNQQSAINRLDTQVEIMENAYPTINEELMKRNPTVNIPLSDSIVYSNNTFQYSYDRGDTVDYDEKYTVNISSTGINIIDIVTGTVINEGSGLTYSGTSKNYVTTSFGGKNGFSCITLKDTTFIINKNIAPKMLDDTTSLDISKKTAFIWIKSADAQFGFTHTYSITNSSGTFIGELGAETNTSDVASGLVALIDGHASMSATNIGSVIKIVSDTDITDLTITDTFGNQASRAFIDEVSSISDLPLSFGYTGTVVKIIGTAGTKVPYYVIYDGNWKETISGSVKYKIDTTTMPHALIRNADGTFTFQEYFGWADRTIGDDDVTPIPTFLDGNTVIKDVFFIKNRIGFITSNTIELSEASQYGNFFRTTALSYLDSDPISVSLNTTQNINLEYAVSMEDSLMLTSNKFQFRLKAVDVLTYETIEFIPSSAYEINTNVRPLFMNNRVFFIVKRGDYSAVYEFYISSASNTIAGDDITAHCQRYIDGDIDKLSGSPVNNMLFLSKSGSKEIFVYKYYDSGKDRIQSAWFKWTFNGAIYDSFTMNRKLYILIERLSADTIDDWILADGTWNNDFFWYNDAVWINNKEDIDKANQLESIDIFPQDYKATFLDNSDTIIPTDVLLGEWIPSVSSKKQTGSIVEFKTVEIDSETDSSFNMYILDTNRNTRREVSEKYTIGRKPFIGGRAKDIKIGFESSTDSGFRISSVVFEGNVSSRNRRV